MLCIVFLILSVTCCKAAEVKLEVVSLDSTADPGSRIIGGIPVSIQQYPFTVQVLRNSQLSCGGSLVTVRHVLSAAHCFIDSSNNVLSPRILSIRAGSSTLGSGGSVHLVSTVIVHERYNSPIRDNDVAVLLLSSSVTRASIAAIPRQGEVVPDNSTVVHVGWGRTNPQVQSPSSVLNAVAIRKVNINVCAERYQRLQIQSGYPYPVTSNMICAGLLDIGGADACQGDSGGPLIYTTNRQVVVGITSWGYGCGQPMYPGVSARVASYTNWINDTVTRYNAGSPTGSVSALLLVLSVLTASVTKISYL